MTIIETKLSILDREISSKISLFTLIFGLHGVARQEKVLSIQVNMLSVKLHKLAYSVLVPQFKANPNLSQLSNKA